MNDRMTATDRARLFAARERVFTTAELAATHGADAVRATSGLVSRGELTRHPQGVLSLPAIPSDDVRVLDKIRVVAVRPLGEASRRGRKAVEDRVAGEVAKRATRATADTMRERVARHFAEHPVALLSELRQLLGPGAASGVEALVRAGDLRRIEDGLYGRAGTLRNRREVRPRSTAPEGGRGAGGGEGHAGDNPRSVDVAGGRAAGAVRFDRRDRRRRRARDRAGRRDRQDHRDAVGRDARRPRLNATQAGANSKRPVKDIRHRPRSYMSDHAHGDRDRRDRQSPYATNNDVDYLQVV